MAMSMKLPAHTLNHPLTTEDEHILRQVLANAHHLQTVIGHAKDLGMDVSQHEQRTAMHQQFANTALERYFPITMNTPIKEEE